jgi:hypothetical protein
MVKVYDFMAITRRQNDWETSFGIEVSQERLCYGKSEARKTEKSNFSSKNRNLVFFFWVEKEFLALI